MNYDFGVIYHNNGVKNYKLFRHKEDADRFLLEQLSAGVWAIPWKKESGPKIYLNRIKGE